LGSQSSSNLANLFLKFIFFMVLTKVVKELQFVIV